MEQAGLYKITLYENKDLLINYDLFSISNSGEIIELENRPKLEIEPEKGVIKYKIFEQLNDLNQPNIDIINNTIYGWIAKFDFLDNTTKIIDKAFFKEQMTALNTNNSNSREINLETWSKRELIAFS